MLRTVLIATIGLLPPSRIKNRLLAILGPGWRIAPTAVILPSLFWRIGEMHLGENAVIGLGNAIRDLRRLEMGRNTEIGQFNWITQASHLVARIGGEDAGVLSLADEAGITSRHYLDCSGGIFLSSYAVLGGVRSTLLSHGADVREAVQTLAPVRIGEQCYIATNVVIVAGCTITHRCMVAAGAVVAADLTEPDGLYAGTPAKRVRDLPDARFFQRTSGRLVSRAGVQAEARAEINRRLA